MRWKIPVRFSSGTLLGVTIPSVALIVACGEQPSPPNTASQPLPRENTAHRDLNTNITAIPRLPANPVLEFEPDIDLAAEHLSRGNELLAAGKAEDAIREYLLAIKYNPDDEDSYYNLAFAYARSGRRDLAKTNYLKALDIYPDYVEAHNNLGNLLVAEGQFSSAIEHFQRAIELDDQNASARNNLGNALARSGKISSSLVHFQSAIQLKPDYAEAQFNLANAYLVLGMTDDAVAEFSKLVQLQPNFPRAFEQLQKARALQKRNVSNP